MSLLTNQCISILQNGGDIVTALECTVLQVESQWIMTDSALKVIFLIFCSTLVFLMQAGFAMVCSGSVRKKNVQNTMLKNLLDVCGSSISFYFLGYGFAFGGNPAKKSFIGTDKFFMMGMGDGNDGLEYAVWFFQFTFAATAATIVAGTLAERCQMNAYLYYSVLLTGFGE
jgi:Amt family ammonium transporter